MKKEIFLLIFFAVFNYSLFPASEIYRYGIFVASSKGFNENDLPGAKKLVQGVADVFREYCLLDDVVLLEDPDPGLLNAAFERAKESVAGHKDKKETQFFFYYYGHGLTNGLLLNYQVYRKEVLKEKVEAIDAGLKFVFLDACSSQVLSTDGNPDFTTRSEGTVFMTSSTLFQKSFTEVFTPILKAGLMGDADGFIPHQIDAAFFYNEISVKLDQNEQDFVRSVYGLHEYYEYRNISPDKRERVEKLFTALGVEPIPETIHITDLDNQILSRVNNTEDEKIILETYDYNQICFLREQLSDADLKRLRKNLAKVGFKKDNYVTLSELFSYIQARIAEKKVNGQRPTITTGYLSFTEPVPISYFYNKVKLRLAYPGTIFVRKVKGDTLLEKIVTILPELDDGEPIQLRLPPGTYQIIVQTEDAKYAIAVELKEGEEPALPEKLDWDHLISYREGEQWRDKEMLDKKIRLHKKIDWLPPFATFTSFTIPLSFILIEVCYSLYLQNDYNNSSNFNKVERLRNQILEYEKVRSNFYIAAGVCFAIPIIPFIIWMVRITQFRKLNKEVKAIKQKLSFNYLPELHLGRESVGIALNIKI